ncbi:MAG TPA: ankyrin repeat domain-containing protein [Puia sp.]|nr:ankyrin repeat domain-containing protein [Puia sp.]
MTESLFQLFKERNLDKIRKALDANPSLSNEGVGLGDTGPYKGHPLHRLCDAVFAGKISDEEAIEVARILLEHGSNVDGYKSSGDLNTPLIAASSLHAEKLGIFYIDSGADIFYADPRDGATALHWASFCGRDQLVEKLVKNGANINQRDKTYHGTPLSWAVHILKDPDAGNMHHQRECILILLGAGAECDAADCEFLHTLNDGRINTLLTRQAEN